MFRVNFWINRFYFNEFNLEFFRTNIFLIFSYNTFFNFQYGSIYYIYIVDENNNNIIVKVPFKLQNLNDNDTINDCFCNISKSLKLYWIENIYDWKSKHINNIIIYISPKSVDIIEYEYLWYIIVNSYEMFSICN